MICLLLLIPFLHRVRSQGGSPIEEIVSACGTVCTLLCPGTLSAPTAVDCGVAEGNCVVCVSGEFENVSPTQFPGGADCSNFANNFGEIVRTFCDSNSVGTPTSASSMLGAIELTSTKTALSSDIAVITEFLGSTTASASGASNETRFPQFRS